MQFFTVSPNPQPQPNQSHFQKIITYYNDGNTIKPSSSMLLHNHYISVKNEEEFTGILTSLGVINVCSNPIHPFINKKGQTVEYHLEKNTIESRKNTTGPHSMFTSYYLTDMGFPEKISNFALSSVGINVEQKLFSGNWVKGQFKRTYSPNRHIQIVYSDDSKKFDCLDGKGNQILDQNGNARTTHNEFIFNLHLEYKPNATKSLQTQLKDIATSQQVQNISQDVSFEKLFTTEITNFSSATIQDFFNYCYASAQDCTILELDLNIPNTKLAKLQTSKNIKQSKFNNIRNTNFNNTLQQQMDQLDDKILILQNKISKITTNRTILGSTISDETLEILQVPAPVVVATGDHLGVPPAAASDDDPIPDNIANDSSNDSDPNSLAAILDDTLKFSNNTDANTEAAVHSGENAEDTSDISS